MWETEFYPAEHSADTVTTRHRKALEKISFLRGIDSS